MYVMLCYVFYAMFILYASNLIKLNVCNKSCALKEEKLLNMNMFVVMTGRKKIKEKTTVH